MEVKESPQTALEFYNALLEADSSNSVRPSNPRLNRDR